jgi:hypothetical protein
MSKQVVHIISIGFKVLMLSINISLYKNRRLEKAACIRRKILLVIKPWKVLKCGAGEGWKRSVGLIM